MKSCYEFFVFHLWTWVEIMWDSNIVSCHDALKRYLITTLSKEYFPIYNPFTFAGYLYPSLCQYLPRRGSVLSVTIEGKDE